MKKTMLSLIILFTLSGIADAQDSPAKPEETPSSDSATYLKIGLARWRGDVSSNNVFTNWRSGPSGPEYKSIGLEIETYFDKNHLQLSGWSLGYRKDDIRYAELGHMFSGKAFRTFGLKGLELKSAAGIEWGMPSLSFDKTNFSYAEDGTVSYKHIYPYRNSNIPFAGTTKDGAIYPFMEFSAQRRTRAFLVEGGMRVNIIRFGFDDYSIKNDIITYNLRDKRTLVPYLFINFGLKMF